MFSFIKNMFTPSDGVGRSQNVKNSILGSIVLKVISIIISLQVVPLTIEYIDPDRYGIWLTVSSIVSWLAYFDLGFANGFRNKFTEARSQGDNALAKAYVSTTYVVLSLIFGVIFICAFTVNKFLDWNSILKVTTLSNDEFKSLFAILASIFCLSMIFNVLAMMLTADQKPALSSFISTLGQLIAFLVIYVLTKFTQGNLLYLSLVFSGVPCAVMLIASIITFRSKKYKAVSPSFKAVKFSLIKNIIGLGSQFFFIVVSMLFIYQFINIILTRVEGPYAVSQYNIAYKYFNVVFMGFVIILNPFWSATTDAYIKRDFDWIHRMARKLELLWLCSIPVLILMVVASDQIYHWWIGDKVIVPLSVSIAVSVYILFQMIANIYMFIINGTGKVRVQMIIYLIFAIVAIPLMDYTCRTFGTYAILFLPTLVYIIQAVFGRIQLTKLITNTATGIWNK